jgi:hypothetical protein
VYRDSVGKPERKRSLERTRCRWVDNTEIDIQKWVSIILRSVFRSGMWGHGLDQCGSGQGQLARNYKFGDEHSGSIQFREFLDWLRTG